MRIATWNINNRVGTTRFRPEAATAILGLRADLVVVTEYFPKSADAAFRGVLAAGGLIHQLISPDGTGEANRVLMASNTPVEADDDMLHSAMIERPTVDRHFPANVLVAKVRKSGLWVIGARIPWYSKPEHKGFTERCWDWLEATAQALHSEAAIITGDLNATPKSSMARGGKHMQRILSANGWHRAEPTGHSFRGGKGDEQIDHLLATRSCQLGKAELIYEAAGYQLCEGLEALSDHAALVVEVEPLAHR